MKLPLVVRPTVGFPYAANFNCIFGQEQYIGTGNPLYPTGDFGFFFTADKGHVDGAGSLVSFDFYGTATNPGRDAGETMRFYVNGTIMNDKTLNIPRDLYLVGAKTNWGSFLARYTPAHGGTPKLPKWYWVN